MADIIHTLSKGKNLFLCFFFAGRCVFSEGAGQSWEVCEDVRVKVKGRMGRRKNIEYRTQYNE